jgi:sulfate permease, SulP family
LPEARKGTQGVKSTQPANTLWHRIFPFLIWWPTVDRTTLRNDLLAGLTGAVIVLPQGVAFAMIAGMPPEYGLYTAIVTPIVAALFGSSRHLISGPTTAISIVVFSTLSGFAEPGSAEFIRLALTLTFLAGVYQLALGLARMGALVNFISHSVVVGFTAGAAILIATSQLKHYLGVKVPSGESFLHTWMEIIHKLPDINWYVATVATVTLAAAIVFKLYRPRWPGMLLAMILGSVLSLALGGQEHGVRLVGSLPSHLPPLSTPDFSLATIKQLAGGALAIAMLGLIEAVSIGRSIATRSHQRIDGNQEFLGQGLSNMVGSFFSAYAGSGSFTRSGINYQAGAKTPMAAIFAALSLAAILLLIAPLTAYLPIAAMAGIILLVAYNLIDFHHIKLILKTTRSDAVVLVVTFLATLFVELEFAIYVGVILSLVLYLNRTARPRIYTVAPDPATPKHQMGTGPDLPQCPQVRIVRIDGSLFFGAVNHVAETLHRFDQQDPERRHVLIIASGINFIDVAGAEMLAVEAKKRRALGGGLYLCKVKEGVCEPFKRGGYIDDIGRENIFDTKAEAIAAIFQQLDRERCRTCDKRIFRECATVGAEAPQAHLQASDSVAGAAASGRA